MRNVSCSRLAARRHESQETVMSTPYCRSNSHKAHSPIKGKRIRAFAFATANLRQPPICLVTMSFFLQRLTHMLAPRQVSCAVQHLCVDEHVFSSSFQTPCFWVSINAKTLGARFASGLLSLKRSWVLVAYKSSVQSVSGKTNINDPRNVYENEERTGDGLGRTSGTQCLY